MTKAEEILSNQDIIWESLHSFQKEGTLSAMKEIAELAWDSCDDIHNQENGQRTLPSEKSEWIEQTFKP